MDLYGSGASIAQANSQTQQAREINEATQDFNNSLAEQLDESNLEQDQDRSAKAQKNILSGATSGGKLAIIGKRGIRRGTGIGGFTELPLKREETLAREVGQERAPLTNPPPAGEAVAQRPVGTSEVYTGEARLAEQEAARASEVAGSAGARTTAEVVENVAGKASKIDKFGVAGLGGGIDAYQDIGRLMEGKSVWDSFGSNSAARIGNIANLVGSALEVAGVATGGVTPWSLALEGTGAFIGLAGSITEGVGEEISSDDAKKTAAQDIRSQARGDVASDVVTQAVGRTQ